MPGWTGPLPSRPSIFCSLPRRDTHLPFEQFWQGPSCYYSHTQKENKKKPIISFAVLFHAAILNHVTISRFYGRHLTWNLCQGYDVTVPPAGFRRWGTVKEKQTLLLVRIRWLKRHLLRRGAAWMGIFSYRERVMFTVYLWKVYTSRVIHLETRAVSATALAANLHSTVEADLARTCCRRGCNGTCVRNGGISQGRVRNLLVPLLPAYQTLTRFCVASARANPDSICIRQESATSFVHYVWIIRNCRLWFRFDVTSRSSFSREMFCRRMSLFSLEWRGRSFPDVTIFHLGPSNCRFFYLHLHDVMSIYYFKASLVKILSNHKNRLHHPPLLLRFLADLGNFLTSHF